MMTKNQALVDVPIDNHPLQNRSSSLKFSGKRILVVIAVLAVVVFAAVSGASYLRKLPNSQASSVATSALSSFEGLAASTTRKPAPVVTRAPTRKPAPVVTRAPTRGTPGPTSAPTRAVRCQDTSYKTFENLVFNLSVSQSKNKVPIGVLNNLKAFYTVKNYSSNFFFEGSSQPIYFDSLDFWYANFPDQVNAYARRQWVISNLRWDQMSMRGSYWLYWFDTGKLVQQVLVQVQAVCDPDRNGRLATKHSDIFFYEISK
jgi:hypothetical protein